MSCYLRFVGTDSALCRSASVLLVLAVHCVVLLGFFGTDIALCRAAWVLLVLAMHCVVLLGLLELRVHFVLLLGCCWY